MVLSGILVGPVHADPAWAPSASEGGDVLRALPGLREVIELLEANELIAGTLAEWRWQREKPSAARQQHLLSSFGVVGAQDALSFRQSYGTTRRARPHLPAVSIGTRGIPLRSGAFQAKMVFSFHQEIHDADLPKVRPLLAGGFEYSF